MESDHPDLDPALVPQCEARLRTIQIYAQRAERSYHRSLKELKALQSVRLFKASAESSHFVAIPDADDTAPLAEPQQTVNSRIAVSKYQGETEQFAAANRMYQAIEDYTRVPAPRRVLTSAEPGAAQQQVADALADSLVRELDLPAAVQASGA